MKQNLFISSSAVLSTRIIYTPSSFARSALIHLQETGTLQAVRPHKSERSGLSSCLFFIVRSGTGDLVYDGVKYRLQAGDCVFIDCRKAYSHETGRTDGNGGGDGALWSLSWCHFYGPNMNAIYRKYQERGGRAVFQTKQLETYQRVLSELYQLAGSVDYVRDMRIHEKLSSLLILLMEDAWSENSGNSKKMDSQSAAAGIQQVKEYLDENFINKITLEELASRFFINKYYLLELFKERYGITIHAYLNQVRITYVKQQLRFTDKTIEELAAELHVGAAYLSRLFKQIEGIPPSAFRKAWKGL